MNRSMRKGYCRDCRANVNHVRRFVSNIAWLLDTLSFQFMGRFRLGHWHCPQCTRKSFYLPLARRDARTIPPLNSKEPIAPQVESAGNFLRSQSLVARKSHASRYSAKYREGVVKKILSGRVTLSEMSREISVPEVELIDWIATAFNDQQSKIRQLTDVIKMLNANGNLHLLRTPEELPADIVESNLSRDSN